MSKKLFMDEREAEAASPSFDELEQLNQIEYTKNYEQSNASNNSGLQVSKKLGRRSKRK